MNKYKFDRDLAQIIIEEDVCKIIFEREKFVVKALTQEESNNKMHIEYFIASSDDIAEQMFYNQADKEWDADELEMGEFMLYLINLNEKDNKWVILYKKEKK